VEFSGSDNTTDEGDASTVGGDTWVTVEQAISLVGGLAVSESPNWYTNYDAALSVAKEAFATTEGKLDGAQNVSYFLSDGVPTTGSGGDGIDSTEEGVWKTFLNSQDIVSYAIGVGSGATQSALDPVAWDGNADSQLHGIVVTEESQLSDVLQATIVTPPTSGNVLTNDTSGADGWGDPELVSVEFNGTAYDFDTITTSHIIELGTGKGSLEISDNGDYIFTPPEGGAYGAPVSINYTAVDADGDTSSASLTISILYWSSAATPMMQVPAQQTTTCPTRFSMLTATLSAEPLRMY
jgi:hypothetical protein